MSEYRPKLGMQNPAKETPLSFLQGLLGKLMFRSSSDSKFQQLTGLSLGTAVEIRKVQSSLRDNWAVSAKTSMRVHKDGAKRWADAARQSVSVRMQDRLAQVRSAKASQASQAPMLNEEVLGLDDIYTAPITGLFTESQEPQPVRLDAQHTTLSKHVRGADSNSFTVSVSDSSHAVSPSEKPCEETEPFLYEHCFDASIRQQARQKGDKASSQKSKQASAQDKSVFERNKSIPAQKKQTFAQNPPASAQGMKSYACDQSILAQEILALAQSTPAHILLQGLISRADMLAAFGAKVSEALSIYPPPSGPVTEIMTTFEPAQPETVKPKGKLSQELLAPPPLASEATSGIRMSDYDENVAADWFGMTEGMAEPHYVSRYSRSQESLDIFMPGERPFPSAQADPLRNSGPSPARNIPRLSIREQLQLDRDLKEDLSSLEYIGRNNRIISDSLSNLVDQYFQKSDLEDEAASY
jgi:hypothetical protein